jgi:hypothetical protein
MKTGKIKAVKKEFKEKRNDKESILTRLSHFIFRNKLPEIGKGSP